MLKTMILPAAAALLFGALVVTPEPAAAHWASAPAAANQANAKTISDVVEVQRRRGRVVVRRGPRRVVVRRGPVVVRPGFYGYAGPRCGWVWSPRRARNVWRCW